MCETVTQWSGSELGASVQQTLWVEHGGISVQERTMAPGQSQDKKRPFQDDGGQTSSRRPPRPPRSRSQGRGSSVRQRSTGSHQQGPSLRTLQCLLQHHLLHQCSQHPSNLLAQHRVTARKTELLYRVRVSDDSRLRVAGSTQLRWRTLQQPTEWWQLQKYATKFKKKHSCSCLDMTFNRGLKNISGVINIPTLRLSDYSKPIFRNLIAFEATPTNSVLCFTAYTACMSCMLQREDDVKLLRERGIVASTNYKDADIVSRWN
uniref:Uncharacterized protein n=1 Tax=Ananas comosus var. bracteatus TaxID=296719 RepID=A0A6V7PLW1_ANACO|nr:unnamed protein product [Ananas comosus var. bracteatus]